MDGQITIFEYLDSIPPRPVEIIGLCDDAYCPECGNPLDEYKELDCETCPHCHIKIDWSPWHRKNDDWWFSSERQQILRGLESENREKRQRAERTDL